ncbi:MAG: hypothetical protein WKG03_01240, partial [Telluria sp.]
TRLWIVLIPVFVLSLIIASATRAVDLGTLSFASGNAYSVPAFVGNLFGLQDVTVPRFGENFPLWSLANETWYYILFPLLVVSFYGKSTMARIASASGCLLIAVSLTVPIILYFSLWLLGAAFSRVQITASALQKLGVVCVWGAVAVYFRLIYGDDMLDEAAYFQHLIFSLPLLVLLSSLQTKADPQRKTILRAKWAGNMFASFSFTLYVIHVPLLVLLNNFWSPSGGRLSPYDIGSLGLYVIILVGILVVSYVFHLPFEAQTHRLRGFLKRKLFAGHDPAAGQARHAA